MDWQQSRAAARGRCIAKYDASEADLHDLSFGNLTREDEDAYLSDLARVFRFRPGMAVLDVGAGTGALCRILSRLPGLLITALEPAPAMLAKLRSKADLENQLNP